MTTRLYAEYKRKSMLKPVEGLGFHTQGFDNSKNCPSRVVITTEDSSGCVSQRFYTWDDALAHAKRTVQRAVVRRQEYDGSWRTVKVWHHPSYQGKTIRAAGPDYPDYQKGHKKDVLRAKCSSSNASMLTISAISCY